MPPIALAEYRGPMDYPSSTARKIDVRSSGYAWAEAEVLRAFRTGCDVRLPSLSDRHGAEGSMVSELVSSCDLEQERMLFELVCAALKGTDLADIKAKADKLTRYVAHDYADLYAEARS